MRPHHVAHLKKFIFFNSPFNRRPATKGNTKAFQPLDYRSRDRHRSMALLIAVRPSFFP